MIELAGCVIRNGSGEILLLHRNKNGFEQWELPGGKVELGESSEDAAVREIREELGVDVILVSRLGTASFTQDEKDWRYTWHEARFTDTSVKPAICEPQSFDDLRYWNIALLKQRADISANLQNLLSDESILGA